MSLVDTTNPDQPIHQRGDQLEAAFLRFADDKGCLTKRTTENEEEVLGVEETQMNSIVAMGQRRSKGADRKSDLVPIKVSVGGFAHEIVDPLPVPMRKDWNPCLTIDIYKMVATASFYSNMDK